MTEFEAMLPTIGMGVVRPSLVMASLPLAGLKPLPLQVHMPLAIALAVFALPVTGPLSPALMTAEIVLMAINEALTGLAIGLALAMVIAAARAAGEVICVAMGLGFSSVLDPQHGTSVPTVGQFLALTSVALFMSLDGPLIVLRLVADSYAAVPVGHFIGAQAIGALNRGMTALFRAALGLAMPVLVATLGVQIALSVIGRLAPQLNLFAIGFPATLIIGLVVLALSMPVIGLAMSEHWHAGFEASARLLIQR